MICSDKSNQNAQQMRARSPLLRCTAVSQSSPSFRPHSVSPLTPYGPGRMPHSSLLLIFDAVLKPVTFSSTLKLQFRGVTNVWQSSVSHLNTRICRAGFLWSISAPPCSDWLLFFWLLIWIQSSAFLPVAPVRITGYCFQFRAVSENDL